MVRTTLTPRAPSLRRAHDDDGQEYWRSGTFRRALIGVVIAATVVVSPASGAIAPDAPTLQCENAAAKLLKKLFGCIGNCQVKSATQAFKGVPFDTLACSTGPTTTRHSCLEKYTAASAKLAAAQQCPPCLDLAGMGANAIGVMNGTFASALYCASAGGPPYPAPHPALPQVVNFGGPVITKPLVYPVTFANEDPTRAATLADFLAQFGASTHWAETTGEYGIGPMTVAPAIIESATGALLDDSDIQTWLAGKLNADDAAFPPVDANTLFVLFYPAGVQITMGGFNTSCSAFGGYHSETTLDAAHSNLVVPYVVMPNCATPGDPNGIDITTAATSHELVEAITDPRSRSAPAYNQVDNDHLAWSYGVGGGELCDLCAQDPASYVPLGSSSYVVQRCWSNFAAGASHDPCAPDPVGQAYFNAAPDLPDTVTLAGIPTKAVTIPTGTSRTILLTLFSDAATDGLITVTAYEPYNNGLSFSFENTQAEQGLNGVSLNLTIAATRNIRSAALFIVKATVGPTSHVWFGLVAQ